MTEDGNFELTVQIIDPSAIKASESSGGKAKAFSVVTTEGETVFDAVRNMLAKLSRKIFFSHVQLIVLNET